MSDNRIMVDTFVAKVKALSAFSRGDMIGVENHLKIEVDPESRTGS